jgi:hypothetical protein
MLASRLKNSVKPRATGYGEGETVFDDKPWKITVVKTKLSVGRIKNS